MHVTFVGSYVKVTHHDIAYYMGEAQFAHVVSTQLSPTAYSTRCGHALNLMQMSDFVVDKSSNSLLKCRQTIEALIDAAVSC